MIVSSELTRRRVYGSADGLLHECRIKKGEGIFIPILSINRSTAIWGEDAHEYKYASLVIILADRPSSDTTCAHFAALNVGSTSPTQRIASQAYGEICSPSSVAQEAVLGIGLR